MKKKLIQDVSFCDVCKKQDELLYVCMKCGTEMCYGCRKKKGVEYHHALHVSGSGDGFYCTKCDRELAVSGNDKLYNAYRKIRELRIEESSWYENFKARTKAAEEDVERLILKEVGERL